VFRQAALSDGPGVSVAEVAVPMAAAEHQALVMLEALADVHLIRAGMFGSYHYDPPVKLFARC
jgi:hypothetical protein